MINLLLESENLTFSIMKESQVFALEKMNVRKLLLILSIATLQLQLLGLEIDRGEVITLYDENDKVSSSFCRMLTKFTC